MDNDNQKLKPVFANRLLLLADFLETLPKEKFNYARWFTNSSKLPPNASASEVANRIRAFVSLNG